MSSRLSLSLGWSSSGWVILLITISSWRSVREVEVRSTSGSLTTASLRSSPEIEDKSVLVRSSLLNLKSLRPLKSWPSWTGGKPLTFQLVTTLARAVWNLWVKFDSESFNVAHLQNLRLCSASLQEEHTRAALTTSEGGRKLKTVVRMTGFTNNLSRRTCSCVVKTKGGLTTTMTSLFLSLSLSLHMLYSLRLSLHCLRSLYLSLSP